jgi:hypothetical protein
MAGGDPIDPRQRRHYTVSERANEEANKLYYDVFKHLTTLSTGSILILATFLESLFADPQWRVLIVVSLLSFVVSIVAAVLMMFFQAGAVLQLREAANRAEHTSFLITTGSFLLGIISFVVFAIRNFLV